MAQYNAVARSNYFTVKDIDALTETLSPFEITIHPNPDGTLCLLSANSNGAGWPTTAWDDETEDLVDVDIAALIAPHLADGSVAVFMEVGSEKLRYLNGVSVAINNKGERVEITLEDIYEKASALGTQITAAAS
jgi:hypothetical protein